MTATTEPVELREKSAGVQTGESSSAWAILRRGAQLSPELSDGIGVTLVLALVATAGRVLVPIAVQQSVDNGINAAGGPDVGFVAAMVALIGLGVVLTGAASALMTARLFRAAERGLATLRITAFRHVHDLAMLTQSTERRGALVARVTSDVDQVSQFLVFGGIIAVVSIGQIVVATGVMLVYSWQLTLVVWLCFLPLFVSLRYFQRRLSQAYATVREQVGVLLSAVSEPVVGAAVVRSYAAEDRTQERIDTAVQRHLEASSRAQGLTAFSFSLGGISAGLANAGVIVLGVPLDVTFAGVGFSYPGGRPVLRDVDLHLPATSRVAVVGETGSGKTTLAKLLTRLMDPTEGAVLLGGVDLRRVAFSELRARVVLVPQEGFLFDATLRANLAYGRLGADDATMRAALASLGLDDWYATLPHGLDSRVGQRGESLSAGERQLVAPVPAQLADPAVLV